ncbi:MAG: sigma-54-dependent Fis family transcriptional regulator [Myxococcales bacterium]|nr:sigma-54-dependent Fis family transcriptional regulator [Myxococcales bacterium]
MTPSSLSAFPPKKPQEATPPRVLIVDDDALIVSAVSRVLTRAGFVVESAPGGEAALAKVEQFQPDVAMVDVHMPGMDGFEVARRLDDLRPAVPVVLMTGDDALTAPAPRSEKGVFEFVRKPIDSLEALARVLKNAAKQHRLDERAGDLEKQLFAQARFGELVGNSPPMQQVYHFIENVAATDSTVLITGESGTGKELVARAIHARSKRGGRPLICVNCAAIPAELVESELFGHSKGAFTGAATERAGLFKSADGGTLFLDEVGDLPIGVQAHLLRALQQGEIKSVGADAVTKVDVRVIAATNVDLPKKIDDGRFRSDLFYRLNVLAVQLPPLRERGDDILLLADRFLERLASRVGIPAKKLALEPQKRFVATVGRATSASSRTPSRGRSSWPAAAWSKRATCRWPRPRCRSPSSSCSARSRRWASTSCRSRRRSARGSSASRRGTCRRRWSAPLATSPRPRARRASIAPTSAVSCASSERKTTSDSTRHAPVSEHLARAERPSVGRSEDDYWVS